ncbi:MAG: hypothetical protein OEZ59_13605, partial [Deltaproteobacteria bacterium]|nr:hypothetical protein [Deltaproteobacteria bacterium]
RDVYLEDKDAPGYIGWPIRFENGSIVFFDLDGKTHIEDIDNISRIRKAENLPPKKEIPSAKKMQFVTEPIASECRLVPTAGGPAIYPTRIIGEKIKIGKFLAAFQNGFRDLEKFRARSMFYARPMMYDQQTKFALTLTGFVKYMWPRELTPNFPFYFQWGSGSPYGPQGFMAIGAKPVEVLPNVEPLFNLRSDVKSSFFTATFVGNPMGISAGKDFIISNRFNYAEFFAGLGEQSVRVLPHFNHLALTGVEYASYSFSGGYYYPLTGVYANGLFREVLSPRAVPIYRAMYITEESRFRLLFSQTRHGGRDPTGDDIRLIRASEMQNPTVFSLESMLLLELLESFRFRSRFFRAGLDMELGREFEAGLDYIDMKGEYRESFPGSDFALGFDHGVTSLHFFQGFGTQVALKGHFNYFERYYNSRTSRGVKNRYYHHFSMTVAIEFVL